MGLMGQVMGGFIGFALGGPVGAILGAIIGGGMTGKIASPMNEHQRSQTTYFVTTFSMLGKMAQADGKIDQREIELVQNLLQTKLALDEATKQFALKIFHEATRSRYSFNDFATQFYNVFNDKPEMLHSMLDLLTAMAMADGVMSPEEETLLNSAASIFRLSRNEYQHVKGQYSASVDHYYSVLDCDPTVSDDELKKKYRKLVREYHPDMIISKGLPEEFTKFAREKFQEIQDAYEKIKAERNLQ